MSTPVGFVTLHTAFHPERGDQDLAAAIREQQLTAANKWGAVWAEATLVVEAEEEDDALSYSDDGDLESPTTGAATAFTTTTTTSRNAPWRESHLFDLIFGVSFSVAAVASTVGVEVGAAVVFVFASVCYNLAAFCQRQERVLLHFWWALFQLLYVILHFVDCTLLTMSILVAEVLAALGFLLTAASGNQGPRWHQYIRKMCHLTRWAFRDVVGWEFPERAFPLFRNPCEHSPTKQAPDCSVAEEATIKDDGDDDRELPIAEAVVTRDVEAN